jgi:uncharacterized membrane protein YphA (DoxX/SURF4 family)
MAKRVQKVTPLGMVLIRVVTGAVLTLHGWRWLMDGTLTGSVVLEGVEDALPGLPGAVAWWGENVLLVNPDAFAFFTRWAALVIGILFVVGALTRPAGLAAVLFLGHAIAYGPVEAELALVLLAVSAFACSVSGAGRRLGLDALFDEHFPSWMTWTRSSSSSFLS